MPQAGFDLEAPIPAFIPAAAPLPVEAGRSTVTVTVSGSVQLH